MSILNKLTEIFNRRSTSHLRDIATSIDNTIDTTVEDIRKLDKEYEIPTSEGVWLDEHSSWFGIPRGSKTDKQLREAIFDKVYKKHSTINALKESVKKVLGEDTIVEIYETYVDLAIFNQSAFSGKDRYPDGEKYRFGVVVIRMNKPVTNEVVIETNKIKAEGIRVYYEYVPDLGE